MNWGNGSRALSVVSDYTIRVETRRGISIVQARWHVSDKHKFKIFVGQDQHEIDTDTISYERVVDLYLGQGGKASPEYLVKFSHGPHEQPTGTLIPGKEVKVKDGMRFRVSAAGES
jgi:hypothetical protein